MVLQRLKPGNVHLESQDWGRLRHVDPWSNQKDQKGNPQFSVRYHVQRGRWELERWQSGQKNFLCKLDKLSLLLRNDGGRGEVIL